MSDYEIVGPFESYWVLVGDRQVPFLKATPANGGIIRLTLDQRYGVDVPVADAEWLIPFVADCIAVAMGYTCHPRPGMKPVRSVPFPPVHGIEQLEATNGDSPARW